MIPLQGLGLEAVLTAGDDLLRLVGIGALSAAAAALIAAAHRWYARDAVSEGVAILFGLSATALYLNVRAALGDVVAGETELFATTAILFNLLALAVALGTAPVGRRIGDRLVADAVPRPGGTEIEASVGALVATLGRGTAITLPEEVGDMAGYDPVPQAAKDRLAGSTFVFGGRLDEEALRDRLIGRIKAEENVAHVDVELEGRTVSYLAVGERVTGLGPTLGPGTAAVAVDADPPAGAGPGDLVQLWTTDPPAEWATTQEPRRVLTAELRDVHDDVVTIACDGADAPLVAGGSFRLLTLPTEPSHERQFASLLRAADETMAAVPVRPESDLVGRTVGELEATIVAVRPADGAVEPIPSRSRTVAAGETLYVVARPEVLRRLDAAAGTPTSAPSRGS